MKRTRIGITLIELLVVLSIISILIGLILVAAQQVRQSAAKLSCQNQLKQLALSMHHYHELRNSLPIGHRPLLNSDLRPYTGWTLDLLPFLEQSSLDAEIKQAFRLMPIPFTDPPHIHRTTVVKHYLCPSDPRITSPQVSERTKTFVAFTSYLGVSGRNYQSKDGLLIVGKRIQFTAITDGTSNTLMMGERPPSSDFQFGWWYSGTGQRLTGSGDIILGVREQNLLPIFSGSPCGPGSYPFRESNFNDPCGMFHFWSPHSGGANFAMGDGSIRFLRFSIKDLLPALASRDGGESQQFD